MFYGNPQSDSRNITGVVTTYSGLGWVRWFVYKYCYNVCDMYASFTTENTTIGS